MAEYPPPLSFSDNPALTEYINRQQISGTPAYLIKRPRKSLRDQNEGKRWIRRKDNARFEGNSHIVAANQRDYALQTPLIRSTFPEPLPPFLPRNARLPTTIIPIRDPHSANAGRFSMSLRGMRRELRKSGLRAEVLVREIESEVVRWLRTGGTILAPDGSGIANTLDSGLGSSTPIGETGSIFEMSRTPLQLIWSITNDAFARYVVHCCARYYGIVSFSKEISGQRFTYLLRPNVVYPDHHAPNGLDTPPMTDSDYSPQLDMESDQGSLDIDSDMEQNARNIDRPLSTISESEVSVLTSELWSAVENADEELDSGAGLTAGLTGLSLLSDIIPESTRIRVAETEPRYRVYGHHRRQERSTSSPSRSPQRQPCYKGLHYRRRGSKELSLPHDLNKTFYDYLFS